MCSGKHKTKYSMLMKSILFICSFSLVVSQAQAVRNATPANNQNLETELNALTGTSLASMILGLAPFWFISAPAELASYGSEMALKHAPAKFNVNNISVEPNSEADGKGGFCKYFLGTDANKSTTAESLYFLNIESVSDADWGNLTTPVFYHPNGTVKVSADNPEYFDEGKHEINWKAETQLNKLLDIYIPTAMLPFSVYSEYKTPQKAIAKKINKLYESGEAAGVATKSQVIKATNKARQEVLRGRLIKEIGKMAKKLNLIPSGSQSGSSTSEVEKVLSSFEKTSAVNRAKQNVTVWDTHPPYFYNVSTNAVIENQNITLEATDFGGVRLGRVKNKLKAMFNQKDDCSRPLTLTEPPNSLLLKVDDVTPVTWTTSDAGPYKSSLNLSANQQLTNENVITTLTQNVTVVDTQAPLLLPPPGFARESTSPIDLTIEDFPLGRPKIIDLADPRPTYNHTAPDVLEPDHRYAVVWQAMDKSGNVTVAPPENPDQYTQYVTIKSPGTNTQPVADAASAASITSRAVEIALTANDSDFLDGRYDPLDFKIKAYPANGQFEAPLYPFFIEDFRLSPVGDHETIQRNEIVRTSPLKHLADAFRLANKTDHQSFLTTHICNPTVGTTAERQLNLATFNRQIPPGFVYMPTYVHVDDAGYYYVRDNYFVCNGTSASAAKPRISKWAPNGEFIKMLDIKDKLVADGLVGTSAVVPDRFSMDNGLIWFALEEQKLASTVFGAVTVPTKINLFGTNDQFSIADPNNPTNELQVLEVGEITETVYRTGSGWIPVQMYPSESFKDIVVDENKQVLYELRGFGFRVEPASIDLQLIRDVYQNPAPSCPAGACNLTPSYSLDTSEYMNVCSSVSTCSVATDIELDSEGYVYVTQPGQHRILKYAPAYQDTNGKWQEGELIGWMGTCSANRLDSQNGNVPFNACDEATGTSRGFQCTDTKCTRSTLPGNNPGQFNNPISMEMGPGDILYVSDRDNSRVQRFASDGTFAGQAKSEGTGINQGTDPDFVLGNFGKPKYLSVNKSSFHVINSDAVNGDNFLHIFKTLPFYDVTDNSAKVKYVSNYNFRGQDQFTYIVDDGIAESEPATVSVDVSRAYRPPEALVAACYPDLASAQNLTGKLDTCTLNEDSSIVLRMSSKDPDGFISTGNGGLDSHTFTITSQPQHGKLSLLSTTDNAAIYRYIPDADYNGDDSLAFNAFDGVHSAKQGVTSNFTILPTPDPAVIEMPDNFVAARGFQRMINADFSDIDENYQPQLITIDWGDASSTFADVNNPVLWPNSGRQEVIIASQTGEALLEQEISPQIDFTDDVPSEVGKGRPGTGKGMLVGSHIYSATGNYPLRVTMANHDNNGFPIVMFPSVKTVNVEVIDATILRAELASPSQTSADNALIVQPDTVFNIDIDVTNLRPETWAGLVATNTQVTIEVPEGMTIVGMDSVCSGTSILVCALGDLNPDETRQIRISASIDLASARESADYALNISMLDDGPKISNEDVAIVLVSVSDIDEDTVIDAVDVFKSDPRYAYDNDHDGIADEWELAYGLNPDNANDATQDTDGDSVNNLNEFLNETYPLLSDAVQKSDKLSSGTTDYDRLGYSVVSGDINGDGFSDVIAGAPSYNNEQGAIIVYYGSADGVTASAPITVDATTGFGLRLATGNINNDEFADVVVKANEGVYLYLGSNTGLGTPVVINSPDATATKFGNAMVISDIDDDNLPDLLIASPDADTIIDYPDNGGVYVYRATTQYWLLSNPQPNKVFAMVQPFALLGDSLVVSDIDGDLIPDLLVSSALSASELVVGFMGYGINDWTVYDSPNLSFILTPEIPTNNDNFGYSMASGQDLDGDGIDDLVVGAYANDGAGAVYIYRSTDQYWLPTATPAPIKIQDDGTHPGGQFGTSVALAPSATYTGKPVLLIGSNRASDTDGQFDEGRADFYTLTDALEAEKWLTLNGDNHDMLGYSVASAGDVNGDGEPDFVIGAPDISVTTPSHTGDGGYVQIIYGGQGVKQTDSDGDFVSDSMDNCINDPNTDQADDDGDGIGDICDITNNKSATSTSSGGGGALGLTLLLLLPLFIMSARYRRNQKIKI